MTLRPRISGSVVVCLVALLGVGIAMRRPAAPVDRPEIRNAIAYLQSERGRELRVVFFGSSRMQSAILPDEWARRANMKPEAVANLAVLSGRLWDARYMLEQGGGLPPSVELVVIEIAPWDFNRNLRNPFGDLDRLPEQFRHWASFSERMTVDEPLQRVALLAEWMWPLYERRPFAQWLQPAPVIVPEPPPLPPIFADKKSRDDLATAPWARATIIPKNHFANAEFSPFTERIMDAMIREAAGTNRRVVLVQLPARAQYVRTIEADAKGARLYREVQDLVRARVADGLVSAVMWNVPTDCGLNGSVFIDYGHFSPEGAQRFTNRLFDEIGVAGTSHAVGPD